MALGSQRVPSSNEFGTPQRRSHHDLQLLINELFEQRETIQQEEDGSRKCQCRELPHLVAAFQERRNLVILQDQEFASLESFAEQHPDIYVSSEDLVGLLTAITPSNNNNAPESPTAKYTNRTLPTPPPSNGGDSNSDAEDVPSTSRGRSASTSSGSSRSSRGSNVLTGTGTLEGSTDASDEVVFPRSFSMPEHLVSPPGTPLFNPRKKTSSDPDKPDLKASASAPLGRTILQNATPTSSSSSSSLIARQRSSPLEAAVPIEGFRRTRPAPPKTRRTSGDTRILGGHPLNSDGSSNHARSRQSSEEQPSPRPISPWDGVLSPNMPSLDSMMEQEESDARLHGGGRSRHSSSRSNARDVSPLFSTSPNERAFASASPLFQPKSPALDPSPFHVMPRSPPLHDMSGDISLDETISSMHTRPVSTASLNSESALHEMITHLQQELSRKTSQLDAQRADGYSSILEKESQLEEVRAELNSKRREEKELRGKEKIYVAQIGTLEVQTGKYKDERDKAKAAYQNARKQYEEQCNESEKLRNTIRAKDEELRLADENVQNGNSDLAKITRERDFLQSTISRLEEELSEARLQIEVLEEQKSENLSLKETIDRLRLDLDELRAQAKLNEEYGGSSGLRRSASGSDGLPGTISRNLGRELMRKLQNASNDDGEYEDGKGKEGAK